MLNPSAALTAIKIPVRGKVKPVSFDQKALTGDGEVIALTWRVDELDTSELDSGYR